jgi:PAS domain S-box-containing protein
MAVLDQERVDIIKQYLRWHPRGLTISDLTSKLNLNRNLVAKYLDMLLISGQVEMQVMGAAKVYFLSRRVPISAMLEFSSDYVIVLDTEQRVIQVNEPVLKLLNEKREALIGKKIGEINNPFFSRLPILEPVKNGQTADEKITEISSVLNGETLHFRVKLVPTVFEDGGQGVTFIIEDITAKKTYEETLQMSEARYRGIVEDQTEFITRFRPDGTLIFLNDSYASYLGSRPADLLGRYHIPGINDEDCAVLNQALRSLDKEHPVTTIECRISDQSGRVCWNLWTIRALFNDEGVVHEYQGVGRDISEKREAAARINNYISERELFSQKLQEFIELSPDADIYRAIGEGLYELLPGSVLVVNSYDAASNTMVVRGIFGKKERELFARYIGRDFVGVTLSPNVPPPEIYLTGKVYPAPGEIYTLYEVAFGYIPKETCDRIEEELNMGNLFSMAFVWQGVIFGSITFALRKGEKIENIALIETYGRAASIVLQRQVAEDALKKSEQLYRSVINNIQDVFYRTDLDGNLIMASPSWAYVLGYDSLDECLGRNIAETFYMQPANRKEFLEAVYRDGEVRDYEVVLKQNDGTPLFVAVSSHLYHDESGAVLGVEGIVRDITERHAAVEKIKNHIAQMDFFSRKLQEFIELSPDVDIYHAIGAGLEELLPDTAIVVSSYESGSGTLIVKAVFGEKERDCVARYFGKDFFRISVPVDENVSEKVLTGKVYPVKENLHDLLYPHISAESFGEFVEFLNLGNFYSVGLVWQDLLLGNMTFALRKGTSLKAASLIETYARAASLALQRQIAEDAFKESERKRAEDALKNSENYLLTIFNATQSGLVVIDPETRSIYDANSTAIALIDKEKGSLIGSSCNEYLCPVENQKCPVIDLGQELIRSEGVLRNTKGEERPIIKTVVPVQLGGRSYLLESFIDISERKRAEEALRASEKRFQSLAEMLPQSIWECDDRGNVTFVNHRTYAMYGYTYEDVAKGMTIWQTIHPDDRERVLGDFIRASTEEPSEFPAFHEFMSIRKDGSTFPLITYHVPIVHENKITGMRGIGIDISERKHAEVALKESEERFRLLVESVPFGIIFITGNGTIEYANPAFEKICGYTREEIPDFTIWGEKVFPDAEYREKIFGTWFEHIQTLSVTNLHADNIFHIHCRDGKDKDILFMAAFFTNGKVLVTIEDIIERKRAEETIHESGIRLNPL